METAHVVAPRPIRLGEPGYWHHLHDFLSRTSDEDEDNEWDNSSAINVCSKLCKNGQQKSRILDSFAQERLIGGQLRLNLAPTLPTYTESLYTLDGHQRSRLPCECFNSPSSTNALRIPQDPQGGPKSEFERDDRLCTTNLIDWQTKESWISDTMRNQVYSGVPRLYGSTDFRLTSGSIRGAEMRWTTHCPDSERDVESPIVNDERSWVWPKISSAVNKRNFNLSPATIGYSSEDSNSGYVIMPTRKANQSPVFFEQTSTMTSQSHIGIKIVNGTSANGQKTFKCDHADCLKRFARKEELTRHKKTHCSDRPFQCEICKRKFNRKDHMTKHQATHQDVSSRRRYFCPSPGCDRCYTRSDALSRHRSSAHAIGVIHSIVQRHG